MKRKSAVGWTFMWILLLAGVLAFLPQAPLVEPTTGNLVPNGDFSSAMSGWGWAAVVIVGAAIWYFAYRK